MENSITTKFNFKYCQLNYETWNKYFSYLSENKKHKTEVVLDFSESNLNYVYTIDDVSLPYIQLINNFRIVELSFANSSLGNINNISNNFVNLIRAFQNTTTIRKINLENSNFLNSSFEEICSSLKDNTNLLEVNLAYNNLTDKEIKIFTEIFGKHKLERIYLEFNEIELGDQNSWNRFSIFLINMNSLKEITLHDNLIQPITQLKLIKVLTSMENFRLEVFTLSNDSNCILFGNSIESEEEAAEEDEKK